ncbi:hypothetical protein M0804_004702 [Polistes exclamans]|nr:hypothetical protein M0804_004702 [Polistes exclamans]
MASSFILRTCKRTTKIGTRLQNLSSNVNDKNTCLVSDTTGWLALISHAHSGACSMVRVLIFGAFKLT